MRMRVYRSTAHFVAVCSPSHDSENSDSRPQLSSFVRGVARCLQRYQQNALSESSADTAVVDSEDQFFELQT